MYGLIFGFPIPIILALLFSVIKNQHYRSFLQVACYLPHFVSAVVVTTIIRMWCVGPNETLKTGGGLLYQMFVGLGWNKLDNGAAFTTDILLHPKFFRPIYQVSGIWEGAGYGSIVYFAAILAISPTSYEAARIDGASKLQQIRYVTFPGMAPTLTIMLITRIGHILNIGYEKIILLVEDKKASWVTADVISTYVYRMSGRSAAENITPIAQVGIVMDLFNAIIAMVLVLGANAISRRVSSTSLF
jgi:putative aldouronate transport system permease protein